MVHEHVEGSAVLGWCQRPGEFLESFWSEVHTGRLKRLGSNVTGDSCGDSGGDGVDAPVARHKQGGLTCQHDRKDSEGR